MLAEIETNEHQLSIQTALNGFNSEEDDSLILREWADAKTRAAMWLYNQIARAEKRARNEHDKKFAELVDANLTNAVAQELERSQGSADAAEVRLRLAPEVTAKTREAIECEIEADLDEEASSLHLEALQRARRDFFSALALEMEFGMEAARDT